MPIQLILKKIRELERQPLDNKAKEYLKLLYKMREQVESQEEFDDDYSCSVNNLYSLLMV